jgi:uncharacterized membrane protein HdeD (DUF308 family)
MMKPLVIVGILLIVLGVFALAYEGISYTKTERVIDLGPIKVDAEREKTIPLPPVLGALSLVGGVALLIASRRRS